MEKNSLKLIVFVFLFMACDKQADLTPKVEKLTKNAILEWHTEYWNTYRNLQFTDADKFYAEDLIAVSNEFLIDYNEIIETHRNAAKSLVKMNCVIDSLKVSVIDKNHANLVGFGYGSQVDTSEKVTNMRFNYIMNVKKEAGDWQIKTMHEYVNYYPLGFDENVPPEKRTGNIGMNYKFRVSLMHTWSIFLLDLEYMKSNGIKLNSYAKNMGESFAKGWNASGGFDAYCRGMIRNCQVFSTETELLEKTDGILRLRMYKYYKKMLPSNISDMEVLDFWEITNNVIAEKMGAKLTVDDDGDYFVLNIIRK